MNPEFLNGLSRYLRFESGLPARQREVAILITAREHDQAFEWAMHESTALKEGVPSTTIEAIRQGAATDGLDEGDAVIIELGRQLFGRHKVDAAFYARAKHLFGERALMVVRRIARGVEQCAQRSYQQDHEEKWEKAPHQRAKASPMIHLSVGFGHYGPILTLTCGKAKQSI